jgi:DNA-binding XRE family transcriptional regulator
MNDLIRIFRYFHLNPTGVPLESIQLFTDEHDDVLIPNEVVEIMLSKDVTIQAAWRIYRGLTQTDVAEKLGIKQAAVSQFEKSENPRKDNIERLAQLYQCKVEQLTMD